MAMTERWGFEVAGFDGLTCALDDASEIGYGARIGGGHLMVMIRVVVDGGSVDVVDGTAVLVDAVDSKKTPLLTRAFRSQLSC